ncbi:uncharacterized protein LOC121267171 [Juglans microcarpa x Juglans regia]|uniref:uncharacterized protein LOC121267171 n=1 Tax=Juglans microcarpa x Juglans regia TaxID=2249226 RepID=UPI001B7F3DE8|nr:uncharacterized protein LOC121267171 [Juglans microcarpa x Juglans regia]
MVTDYEALKYTNRKHKLSRQHAKWVAYLQEFMFSPNHQSGNLNRVADALSRRVSLLTTMSTRVAGFDNFRKLHAEDLSIGKIFKEVNEGQQSDFLLHNGFLFHVLQLCIPDYSLREHIIWELHGEGPFGQEKTLALIAANYY